MSPSFNHPSLLLPLFGDLAVRLLVLKKTKQNSKISMLRDNRGSAHHSNWYFENTNSPPPPMELVVQGEAGSAAAVPVVVLNCTPNRGHRSIWMRLQKLDPIFNLLAPKFYI
jgi:hypothetical protein